MEDYIIKVIINGDLKTISVIVDTLGIGGLREMGYNITKINLKPRFEELPSIHEMELEEIAKSTEDLIFQINSQSQTDELFKHPLHKLLGLDKQLRSIRGSLKVEVAKKLELEECIAKEQQKLEEFQEYPRVYDDAMQEDITK